MKDTATSEAEAASSLSASSSESETTTGVDADTEESVTSEEETEKIPEVAVVEDGKKDKWVAIKSTSSPDPATNTTATP